MSPEVEEALDRLGIMALPERPSRQEIAGSLDVLAEVARNGDRPEPEVLDELASETRRALRERSVKDGDALVDAALEGWPAEPREPGPPEPEPLPLDALPVVLRDFARTISEATQAPQDSAVGVALGGVSVAVVGKATVEICPRRGWRKPAHTYVGIEQPSGTGKSPLINAPRDPIAGWETGRAQAEAPGRRWAEEEVTLGEERVKELRKKAAKGDEGARDELEDALKKLRQAEEKPRGAFQLLIQDATEEEVVRVLAGNGGRAASVDPEGTILEVAAGRYGNGDARLAALTHGWDGEAMRVDRVTRERVDLPSANLALLVGIQPGVLEGMVNAETMKQRGVLARFLWIAPEIRWDEIKVGAEVPPLDTHAVERYADTLRRILDSSDLSEVGARTLTMSPEAQEGVHRLERRKVEGMQPGGHLESVPAFAGKLPDHGARIAALISIAHRGAEGTSGAGLYRDPIPGWAMEAAERLVTAISTHVVKVTGNAGGDGFLADLRYLLARAKEMHGDTESNIREKARARERFRDADHARKAFDELEKRGCLRRVKEPEEGKVGRPSSPRIEIHPRLRSPINPTNPPSESMRRHKSEKSEVGADPEVKSDPLAGEVTDV